jgi:serine/threonine-protein kinase HipA
MNGELVGTWKVDRYVHTFTYERSWIDSPRRRSLSLSLPISAAREVKGEAVRNYFDNLLPDNEKIRTRLGKRFGADPADVFDLLQAIGRDCVGAVQLLPENQAPQHVDRIDAEPLADEQVAELLAAVPSDNMAELDEEDTIRISIAGAQEKTALLYWRGQWHKPLGATPTTHIIKLPLGLIGGSRRVDAGDSVHNEWLCARILDALGLPVADSQIARFGGQDVLVVERFDRAWQHQRWIARLPQEDFCQAWGISPEKKYETDGGPGIMRCLELLQGSQDRNDTALFLLTQLSFTLLAATDGHAKNFSIFLNPGDAYTMTPLYDVLSMWPYYGQGPNQFQPRKAGPAMVIRGKNPHKLFHTIKARHWRELAFKNGGEVIWHAMIDLLTRVPYALTKVKDQLPQDFPERTWMRIADGMQTEARRFIDEIETDKL